MPSYELIQPYTLQSWVAKSIINLIIEEGFYVNDEDDEDTFLYWTDRAKTYDGFDWDNPNEELGFWLHIVYQMCEKHYELGTWRDVKRVIVKRLKELLSDNP